jgi:hypothetical protein
MDKSPGRELKSGLLDHEPSRFSMYFLIELERRVTLIGYL